MRPLRVVSALAITAAIGCLFPSLAELGGDGGADAAVEAAGGDAASDAGATPDVADERVELCTTIDATFCEDFDEPNGDYAVRWTTNTVSVGNSLGLSETDATSPPNALVATIPSGYGGAALWKNLPQDVTTIEYSFDVLFDPYDAGTGSVLFGGVEVDSVADPKTSTGYRLAASASGAEAQAEVYTGDGGSTIDHLALGSTFQPNHWYHVDETLQLTPPPTRVTIVIDGAGAITGTFPSAMQGTGYTEFLTGVYDTVTPTGAWTMHFDDVVVRAQ